MTSRWGITPRQRVEALAARTGATAVVDGCLRLLAGRLVSDDFVIALGGPGALSVLDGRNDYWPRVWALRALLYCWHPRAAAATLAATADPAWRVREMAVRVIARHLPDGIFPNGERLLGDPVARVRAAAERALLRLTEPYPVRNVSAADLKDDDD